jgi:hypothetical protein
MRVFVAGGTALRHVEDRYPSWRQGFKGGVA